MFSGTSDGFETQAPKTVTDGIPRHLSLEAWTGNVDERDSVPTAAGLMWFSAIAEGPTKNTRAEKMLYRIEKLIGMSIGTSDGEIGKVKDIYFEENTWVVRYLIVQTGNWLEDRKVLVSPIAVKEIDWANHLIRTSLTPQQVRAGPGFDSDKPIYRQNELDYFAYYGYPVYWNGILRWGATSLPNSMAVPNHNAENPAGEIAVFDPHLRSVREITGYRIHAKDRSIGHLEDFLMEEENWVIRYLIIDTHNGLHHRHVTIPPNWIEGIRWKDKRVDVDVTMGQVHEAPEYDPASEFSRELEEDFYRHYERPGHWWG